MEKGIGIQWRRGKWDDGVWGGWVLVVCCWKQQLVVTLCVQLRAAHCVGVVEEKKVGRWWRVGIMCVWERGEVVFRQ